MIIINVLTGTFGHLIRRTAVDDRFDEDAQVLPRLPRLVSFEADAESRRSAVIERHLERELLLPALGDKGGRQAGQLILLGVRVEVGGGDGWRRGLALTERR